MSGDVGRSFKKTCFYKVFFISFLTASHNPKVSTLKKIITLNGSLRQNSSNKEFINFLKVHLKNFEIDIYDHLGDLPHFNPDLETPGNVLDFKEKINLSDYLLIVTPEYAHGIPGVLKNALDWLVSDELLPGKKVILFVCSAGDGQYAMDSLLEVTRTMSFDVVAERCFCISRIRSRARENFKDENISEIIAKLKLNL